ncbi:DUF5133 domain-containing protein [Streptomyces sp. NPDC006512]|uniref:DUF5133 domain-containing protein n=1 Tax=Streptomyces sp. NPDC006512 TaxID=3154307 RepID=UPI0033BF098B
MSPSGIRRPRPTAVAARPDGRDGTGGDLVEAQTASAVGMLMAMTPCSARDAHLILAAAADLARTTPEALASALAAGARGTPVPRRVERAVRRAVQAARAPAPPGQRPRALTPARTRTEEALTRLRACQARLAATPGDPAALREMDDAAYTLCVLMGRPTAHDAVLAALEHLAPPAAA